MQWSLVLSIAVGIIFGFGGLALAALFLKAIASWVDQNL